MPKTKAKKRAPGKKKYPTVRSSSDGGVVDVEPSVLEAAAEARTQEAAAAAAEAEAATRVTSKLGAKVVKRHGDLILAKRRGRGRAGSDDSMNNDDRGSEEEGDDGSTAQVLSDEYILSMGGVVAEGDNALVLPSRKKKKKSGADTSTVLTAEEKRVALQLNKRQKRKLDTLELKRVKEQRREKLHATLQRHAMSDVGLALMQKTSNLGGRTTLKGRLSDAMARQRAGLEVSSEQLDELHKTSRRGAGEADGSTEQEPDW